jgi:Na+:H+ antiporter, NhaA family
VPQPQLLFWVPAPINRLGGDGRYVSLFYCRIYYHYRWCCIKQKLNPFAQFVQSESFAGVLLVCSALLAFVIANSALAPDYFQLKDSKIGMSIGDLQLKKTVEHWVNDGLMVLFFLLVGLEIKREVLVGELSNIRQASLAIVAAFGGMVVPAGIFALFNLGTEGLRGWGVPMATDIAFALGVLLLLGTRIPLGLKVFLTALAIVDDLGAVVVIAVFYTEQLNLVALAWAVGFWLLAMLAGFLRLQNLVIYAGLGLLMWYFTLQSGIHATVAGVLLALAIPLARQHQPANDLNALEGHGQQPEEMIDHAQSPLHRLEYNLQSFVTYAVLPVFAFLNAGVALAGASMSMVTVGVFFGLLLGKPLGVLAASWLALRLGIAVLPNNVTWPMMIGVAILAGIGFTMALFIGNLAFTDTTMLDQAKIGVLAASVLAALLGAGFLLAVTKPKP